MLPRLRYVPRIEAFAATTSLVVSLGLLALKFAAYYLTGSAAIFSDALESIVNVAASGVALYSLALAHQPADALHPYGHGKAEFLSAAFEGGMILLAAAVITIRAIEQWIAGDAPRELGAGLVLITVAGACNGAVGMMLVVTGRRRGSITLVADGKHLLSDAVTSAGVLAALGLMALRPAWTWIDPVAALLVAAYIAWMGAGLLARSTAGLMDRQDVEDERLLRRILDSHVGASGAEPRICSYHKLRHRHSGRYHWVDFHIMVPPRWDIRRGHEVASVIEHEIERALGQGNATAHVEPCVAPGCRRCGEAPAG